MIFQGKLETELDTGPSFQPSDNDLILQKYQGQHWKSSTQSIWQKCL